MTILQNASDTISAKKCDKKNYDKSMQQAQKKRPDPLGSRHKTKIIKNYV